MKFLPTRTTLRAAVLALAIPALLVAGASLPWTPDRTPTPPRVVTSARGSGALRAGAAEARFSLPPDAPIGGFTRLSYASEGTPGPVGARAIVLEEPGCRVALVGAEILLVPESLQAEVASRVADLRLDGLVLAATHTHAGPGGYWENVLGQRIATGSFDARIREAIVSAVVDAIRRAASSLAPARLSTVRSLADDLARSRSGGLEDAPLTVVRVERTDGVPIAELTVFAAHATLLGKRNRVISGDWPGRYLQGGAHGLRLFFQGSLGDQSTEGPAAGSPRGFANALSSRVDALSYDTPERSPRLAFAAAEAGLPDLEIGGAPALLRRAARNLAARTFPATARVEAIRLGSVLLVAVPAEPVSAVGATWRAALPPGAAIVSLANGYLGYIEQPQRMESSGGETVRTYFGPALEATLGAAARAAAEATEQPGARAR